MSSGDATVSANGTVHPNGAPRLSEVGFAPLFFGFSISTVLYGILVLQAYVYYFSFKGDRPWLRTLVFYLFTLETSMSLYNGIVVYGIANSLSITGEFMRFNADSSQKMMTINTIFTVLMSTPVQVFLAWRIRVIDGPKVVSVAISMLSAASFVAGMFTAIRVPRSDQVVDMKQPLTVPRSSAPPPFIWLGCSAIADVLIAVTLVYTLHAKRTGFQSTDAILKKLIRLTIETGLLTLICTVVEAGLYASSISDPLYIIPDMMISKLYVNSLVATLNARAQTSQPSTTSVVGALVFASVGPELPAERVGMHCSPLESSSGAPVQPMRSEKPA